MKLKKLLLFVCIMLFPISVKAASGKINVTGTSSAVVGNTVTITVTLSSGTPIGSWDMDLKYDKSYLQLISTNSEAGGISMVNSSSGTKKKSYTFKFKALKSGKTSVGMSSYSAYAYEDMSSMDLSVSSKNVRIMTQQELEASYSKDNTLKSLGVEGYELSPAFNKETLAYSVNVPENTKSINIIANKNDSNATVSGAGEKEVTSGTNNFEIVVRAQNGAERTYTLKVDVIDQNPINVEVSGKKYTVVKIREYLQQPPFYNEHMIKINEFDIPAYKNDHTNIVLVGLKDEAGNISLFSYDENNKEYKEYKEIGVNKITIIPKNTDKILEDYQKGKVIINDLEVDCFYYNEDSNFVIIYGINIENGEEGFYVYDKENQNIMRFNDEVVVDLKEQMKLYTYIIIGFSALLVLMFIILIIVISKKKKKGKKKEEFVINNSQNKIIELSEDDKKIDLNYYGNGNKKKRKKD